MNYNYVDDLSEKGKKAYNWVCDFIDEKLEVSKHPWYGLTAYINIDELNINNDMLETINNEFYKHSKDWGFNMISASSGKWGVGDIYCISFDEKYKITETCGQVATDIANKTAEMVSRPEVRYNNDFLRIGSRSCPNNRINHS